MNAARTVPRGKRIFIYAFLLAFVVCGLAAIEAWPLTGWRLFSHVRTQQQRGWDVSLVDASGAETPVPFGRFGVGFRGVVQTLDLFPTASIAWQQGVCEAWTREARSIGIETSVLRIYRTEGDLGRRDGTRAVPGTRKLVETCGG